MHERKFNIKNKRAILFAGESLVENAGPTDSDSLSITAFRLKSVSCCAWVRQQALRSADRV